MSSVTAQMDTVEKKASLFGAIKGIVLGEMTKMRALSKELQDEVIKRAPDSFRDTAKSLEDQINKEWERGIAAINKPAA